MYSERTKLLLLQIYFISSWEISGCVTLLKILKFSVQPLNISMTCFIFVLNKRLVRSVKLNFSWNKLILLTLKHHFRFGFIYWYFLQKFTTSRMTLIWSLPVFFSYIAISQDVILMVYIYDTDFVSLKYLITLMTGAKSWLLNPLTVRVLECWCPIPCLWSVQS